VPIRLHGIGSIQALLDQERRIQFELGKQERRKILVGRDRRGMFCAANIIPSAIRG
jgi:hypothetical protein